MRFLAARLDWRGPLFCLMILHPGLSNSEAQAQEKMRPEVEALLETFSSDFKSPSTYPQAVDQLTNRPDIKPDLLAALQRDYFQGQSGTKSDRFALGALSLRSDLTAAEQKIFTDELERLLAEKEKTRFVDPAINLLAHYPSAEHEALVLKYLNRSNNSDYTLSSIFRTLAAIGGNESHEAMQRVANRLKAKYPDFWVLPELDQSIKNLETRLRQKPDNMQTTVPEMEAATRRPAITAQNEKPNSASQSESYNWWVLGIAGVCIILALAFGCRFFKASDQRPWRD